MNTSSFLGLMQNAALLLAVAFIFDLFANRWRTGQLLFRQAPVGLAIGAIGITIMMTPWIFAPGIVFDTRSVLIGISGLFFGSLTVVIAMAITAAFRYYQGGAAAWTGIIVIIISGLIGIAWRHVRRRSLSDISWRELYLFGLVIHLAMLATMFTLPWQTALQVLSNIALPVILIYPAGTALLGVLMVNRMRREWSDDALRESEEKYRSLVENINDMIYALDSVGRFTYVSPMIEKFSSYKAGDLIGKNFADFVYPDDLPGLIDSFNRTVQGEMNPFEYRILDGDKVRHVRSSSQLILKDGVFAGLTGVMTDISERKQAEDDII
jgi:PAS domain S-box-containing protein